MTKIIATIGPATEDFGSLQFFAEHKVQFARLNFSHSTASWHLKIGRLARKVGMELMCDLAGPKVLLGDLSHEIEISTGQIVALEMQKPETEYPTWREIQGEQEILVLPTLLDLSKFLSKGKDVLIDDGKVHLIVQEVLGDKVICQVDFGGKIKSHKGINLPLTPIDIEFLVQRDRAMLKEVLPALLPEYVAPSFVKTTKDLDNLKLFLQEILDKNQITNYFPKICTKIEMAEAVDDENLVDLVKASDMIMIARGDLAVETIPAHIQTPFLQDKIKQICQYQGKPFIVATQILESMTNSPVPTRAEVSDLYRAIFLDKADFVMLSGESAAGQFPRKCVELMEKMIDMCEN